MKIDVHSIERIMNGPVELALRQANAHQLKFIV